MSESIKTKLKKVLWEWRGVWITAPLAAGLVVLIRHVGLLQSWEWSAYDQYIRLRPQETRDHRIAIVGINELDIQRLGQAILPDKVYADLINRLKEMNPIGIGLDVYRDVRVEPGHQELNQVFESTDYLVGIEKVIGTTEGERVPGASLLQKKNQIASNDLMIDSDGRVRRALLLLRTQQGKPIYSFGAYLALIYLEKQGTTPTLNENDKTWRFKNQELSPFKANDGGYAGADDGGYQVLLNYRGNREHFETVSLSDVLKNRLPLRWGQDRLILIGYTGFSFQDIVPTPFTTNPSERMAGVEVHANIASQIISTALEGRPTLKVWPKPLENAWILIWATLGALINWSQRNKLLSRRRILLIVIALIALGSISYGMFRHNVWIPVVPPALALISSVGILTAYTARSAVKVRQIFSRYLSTEVVSTLLDTNASSMLGGERRIITILVADLRGFTAFCERLSPEEIIKIVNCYLSKMTEVISQYQGTIDGFMGDGILVLFGAPIVREDDSTRAIACGIAMQKAIKEVNSVMGGWGYSDLEMGIGINTGEVVVGNIGSEKRMSYGVVGSQVNLASRIESFTIGGQVLISESTLKASRSNVHVKDIRTVQAKGFSEPITIYDVLGIDSYGLYLETDTELLANLESPQQLIFSLLDEKIVSGKIYQGTLIALSHKSAIIMLSKLDSLNYISVMSNLRITLLSQEPKIISEAIYAKVSHVDLNNNCLQVEFTFLPGSAHSQIDRLLSQS